MTPNTTVTLYSTPFDISNKYVIAAESEAEALGIVSSYPSKVFTDCYWQRDNDFVFRANGNINEIEQYNYCVYLNNGKYNFAFITQCDYVNDAMTLVHLSLDPWLNFAGQYTFHDSPMIRCHPQDDVSKNFFTEPFPVESWEVTQEKFGESADYGAYCIYLVTKMPLGTYNNLSPVTMLQGTMDIINNNGIGALQSYINTFYGGSSVVVGLHPQAATSLLDVDAMRQSMTKILQAGRESDIIGAYYVPPVLLDDTSTGFKPVLEPQKRTLTLTIPPTTSYHWRKMGYSEQFNRIYVNLCGSVTYIPVNQIRRDLSSLTLYIGADPGMNGCIYAWFDSSDIAGADSYMMHSRPWDTVQVTGYGVNQNALLLAGIQAGKTAFGSLASAGERLLAPNFFGLPSLDVTGALDELGAGALDLAEQAIGGTEIVKSGGYAGGSTVSSMAAYNLNFPLVTLCREHVYNDAKLDEMFGTYGYMQNGNIQPITFKQLPHWTYYQTKEAMIEGRKVPQRYLSQIINRFNAGIFVFNSVADYKNITAATAQGNHY